MFFILRDMNADIEVWFLDVMSVCDCKRHKSNIEIKMQLRALGDVRIYLWKIPEDG